jgi:HSP20 family protein
MLEAPTTMEVGPLIRTPRVDVLQTDQNVIVKADLPGVSKENLKVNVDDQTNMLTIDAEKRDEFEVSFIKRFKLETRR